MLDIFNDDAFGVVSLTDAVNKTPFVPGRAGAVAAWSEDGVSTTTIAVEEIAGELKLVSSTPRGAPGTSVGKEKRSVRSLRIPHYQIDDGIMADEVQGVRAFGQESQVETVFGLVNRRMAQHVAWRIDPTLEHQRIGALKGIILDGDGSTVYNLFTEFGVSQMTEVDFDLDAGSPTAGALRQVCDDVARDVADELGGVGYSGLHAFCGKTFWQNLIAHSEVREVYLASQTQATQLLNPMAYRSIRIGDITFEEYRGSVGGTAFVHTDKCHIFPIGVPGLYRTVYAPADYIETVNTPGLPRYAKQYRMPNDKGVSLEVQSNALSYVTRPRVLVKGKRT
jgi:hypothetical protein